MNCYILLYYILKYPIIVYKEKCISKRYASKESKMSNLEILVLLVMTSTIVIGVLIAFINDEGMM